MRFDPVVSYGTLIHLAGMFILVLAAWFNLKADLRDVKTKVTIIWAAWTGDNGKHASYETRLGIVEHEVANIWNKVNGHKP